MVVVSDVVVVVVFELDFVVAIVVVAKEVVSEVVVVFELVVVVAIVVEALVAVSEVVVVVEFE